MRSPKSTVFLVFIPVNNGLSSLLLWKLPHFSLILCLKFRIIFPVVSRFSSSFFFRHCLHFMFPFLFATAILRFISSSHFSPLVTTLSKYSNRRACSGSSFSVARLLSIISFSFAIMHSRSFLYIYIFFHVYHFVYIFFPFFCTMNWHAFS